MKEEYEVEPKKTVAGSYIAECPICIKRDRLFYAMAATRQGIVTALLGHMNDNHAGKNQ